MVAWNLTNAYPVLVVLVKCNTVWLIYFRNSKEQFREIRFSNINIPNEELNLRAQQRLLNSSAFKTMEIMYWQAGWLNRRGIILYFVQNKYFLIKKKLCIIFRIILVYHRNTLKTISSLLWPSEFLTKIWFSYFDFRVKRFCLLPWIKMNYNDVLGRNRIFPKDMLVFCQGRNM